MPRALVLVTLAALAGCADWPDLGIAPAAEDGYPALVPFDDLLGPANMTAEEREEAAEIRAELLSRAEALRRRAATLDLPPEDRAALEALVARVEALTARLEELAARADEAGR